MTSQRNGRTRTQYDRHLAHVGTPVDVSDLPATPSSNDGGHGADFNNYIFAYDSDSRTYLNAMRRAGIRPVAPARIDVHDETLQECVVERTVGRLHRRRRDRHHSTPPRPSSLDAGRRSQLADVFGADTATADALGVTGLIAEADGTDMVITRVG